MIVLCSTKVNENNDENDTEERIINSNSSTMSADQLSLDIDSACAMRVDSFHIGNGV